MQSYISQLPGRWRIVATNFPMWLSGKKVHPTITYGRISTRPLQLSDTVAYSNRRGKTKTIRGVDTARREGFTWRGSGLLKPLRSRWAVVALQENILVIRFAKSLVTPAGMDVLVKEGADVRGIKQRLVDGHRALGIADTDFHRLTWL